VEGGKVVVARKQLVELDSSPTNTNETIYELLEMVFAM
jgi:hypothetical protein